GVVAEVSEPARVLYDHIVEVAVNDEVAATVSAAMHRILNHFDAAEMRAVVITQKFIVVAGHVDDARAFARLPQYLLHHVIVRLRPIPAVFELPAVNDVADQVDRVGLMMAKEIEKLFGL